MTMARKEWEQLGDAVGLLDKIEQDFAALSAPAQAFLVHTMLGTCHRLSDARPTETPRVYRRRSVTGKSAMPRTRARMRRTRRQSTENRNGQVVKA